VSNSTRPILPVIDDPDTGGYWQAAAEGRLVIRACLDCRGILHLPRAYCHHCGSWNTGWREVEGKGSVYSWTVVRQQLNAMFETPYTIVLVELAEAPEVRLLGSAPGTPVIEVGMAVRVRFDRRTPDTTMPQWEPEGGWAQAPEEGAS